MCVGARPFLLRPRRDTYVLLVPSIPPIHRHFLANFTTTFFLLLLSFIITIANHFWGPSPFTPQFSSRRSFLPASSPQKTRFSALTVEFGVSRRWNPQQCLRVSLQLAAFALLLSVGANSFFPNPSAAHTPQLLQLRFCYALLNW